MKKIFCCFVIAILSLFLSSAYAADAEHLLLVKWGELFGDAGIAEYPGYSYANEVSMGISNDCDPLNLSTDCGKYFDGLTISQYASPIGVQLASKCAQGNILDEIDIVSVISKTNLAPLWRIKLSVVIISKIASATNSTDGLIWEAIELSPQAIEWHFYTYSEKGAETGHSCTRWRRTDDDVAPCN